MALDGGMITGFVLEGAIALIEFLAGLPEKDRQKIYDQMRAQKASNAVDAEKLADAVRLAVEARDANLAAMRDAGVAPAAPDEEKARLRSENAALRARLDLVPNIIIPDAPAEAVPPAPIVDIEGVRDILSTWTPEMKAALKAEL